MKYFNFTSLIAMLAAALTLASHADAFKTPKFESFILANCYPNLIYTTTTSCTHNALDINLTPCGFAQGGLNNAAFSNSTLMDADLCSGGSVFCCARLKVGPQKCGLPQVRFPDGTFNYAAIDQIFCQDPEIPNSKSLSK